MRAPAAASRAAFECCSTGVRFPTMIKWSHEAPSGDVPQSWDETDDSKDAGEYTLPGEAGFIVDGMARSEVYDGVGEVG